MNKQPIDTAKTFAARVRHSMAQQPRIHPTALVVKGAHVMGDVTLGPSASVWYGAVLRGDIEPIIVGEASNIQDLAVLHTADNLPCRVGDRVTVGHSAIVHACTVGDECLIGMGAIILDDTTIGPQCIIGANALVTKHSKIPEGSMVMGSPATVVRKLTRKERTHIRTLAARYIILLREHRKMEGHAASYTEAAAKAEPSCLR